MSDLRAIIREMLEAELAGMKSSTDTVDIRQEVVSISTDEQLSKFVRHIIKLSQDPQIKNQLLEGRYIFKLDPPDAAIQTVAEPQQEALVAPAQTMTIESGLITEKDVNKLPAGLELICVSDSVRFTPLASDELRRRRIKIERRTSS